MPFRPSLPWCCPAAAIARRKKLLKSSFSMGFRSYIRHFSGAIFDAFPSLTAMVFSHPGAAVWTEGAAGAGAAAAGGPKSGKNHSFRLDSEVTLGTFWAQF